MDYPCVEEYGNYEAVPLVRSLFVVDAAADVRVRDAAEAAEVGELALYVGTG